MTETMKAPPATVELETHGNLEAFARAVARNWGWDARTENHDIDAYESRRAGYRVLSPGRGELVLSSGDEEVTLDYWLPEEGRRLFSEIESVTKGNQMSRDRRQGRSGAIELRR